MSCVNLAELPPECLSLIMSLTTPSSVVRASLVSKYFLLVSESDTVWEKFLPSDCDEIVSQSSTPLQQFHSKKDLFLHLCRSPVLLNNNTQSFGLDKGSGKKYYMLGARALEIEWGDTSEYWTWKSIPESRFPEVAELKDVCWLDIKGNICTRLLSLNTNYGAYFVFKIDVDNTRGLDDTPVKVCVYEVIDEEGSSESAQEAAVVNLFYLKAPEGRRRSRRPNNHPSERDDGWMEIEMGRYQIDINHGPDEDVLLEMTLKEVEVLKWKSGLIVQGIELRPLD